jgi:hypothetical protein
MLVCAAFLSVLHDHGAHVEAKLNREAARIWVAKPKESGIKKFICGRSATARALAV